MVLTSVYLFNMVCAMIPCSVTQPPPQAFINELEPISTSYVIKTTTPIPTTQNLETDLNFRNNKNSQEKNPGDQLTFAFSPEELQQGARSRRLLGRPSSELKPRSGSGLRSRSNTNSNDRPRPARMTGRKNMSITAPILSQRPRSGSTSRSSPPQSSVMSNLLSAVPVISVLRNNFNNFMRSMSSSSPPIQLPTFLRERLTLPPSDGGGGRGVRGSGHPAPVVTLTNGGRVEGYHMGTMKGRRITAFEGIPYAEPPTGNNRFKPPVPKSPWKNTFQAKKTGSNCLQAHPLDFFRVTGSEDCLFINVYTPKTSFSVGSGDNDVHDPYPVVFLIHGGSFQYGSSAEYGPAYLLDENIILVTANYRLGPLGFLSTGDEESPGNYGLKDQALALKWVNDNIGEMGGDVSRVTIMGQSAGGVSAHLHLVANRTTELFNNGVSLSGTGFGFWPIVPRKRSIQLAQKLAGVLNCPRSSSRDMIRCLKGANAHWITAAQMQLYEWIPFHPLVLFAPVLEDPSSPSAFLTKRPEEAYQAGEVMNKSWIFGQTSQEGHFDIYFMRLLMQAPSIALNGRKYLPIILDYGRNNNRGRNRRVSEITDKLLSFYGGALPGRGIDMSAISEMYTDNYYTTTIRRAIKAHKAIAPEGTFAYVFDYKGKYNLGSLFGSPESEWGVSHTEDMFYYFNSSVYHHGLQRSDPEYGLSQIMTDFLANFASTSTPMHQSSEDNSHQLFWDPVTSFQSPVNSPTEGGVGVVEGPLQYLRIQKELSMIDDPFQDRVEFWDKLGLDTR